MLLLDHLRLLLMKEFLVIRRSKIWTLFEIAIPLIIAVPLITLVVQNSSTVKHEVQFWKPFQVTGDWRDIDLRPGNMRSIYAFCGRQTRRKLGLVFPNHMDKKEILWVAHELEFRYLMNNSNLHSHNYELNVKIFSTETAMMEELMEDYHHSFQCTEYIAGIIFDEYNSSTSRLSYTIRIRQTDDPQTEWYIGDGIWESGGPYEIPDDQFPVNLVPNYWSLGFLSLQYAVDTVFIEKINGKNDNGSFRLDLERIPEPPYFEKSVVRFLSFLIILWQLFILPCVLHTVVNTASEKQSGMKAFLTVMGMQSSSFYIAHALIGFIKTMVVLLSCTILLLPQIQTVSPLLFFSTNFIYGAGAASFALLMSFIFHSPGAAMKGSAVVWLATIALTRLRATEGSVLQNILLSLNLNHAFVCAHHAMQDYMNRDEYLNVYNMFSTTTYKFSFGMAIVMMIFDVLWMSFLAIYLDNVCLFDNLYRKKWFFFLHRSNSGSQQCAFYDSSDTPRNSIQKHEGDDQADIDIRHLTKTYIVQPAVDGMSFRVYRGEITVLLGHNGAGKSTMFSLITGLISPTSGSIYICGNRMESCSINRCQQEIGFCPQYNALFNLLTVREHLDMFRKLSGNTSDCTMELMKDIHLDNVADVIAEKLSGGMKRKLCVGISLASGRRIILLDEPTAGMDPTSRQSVFQLLQRYKHNRTILLTTHSMDEADLLGDRIAIMVRGRLICAGTSEFLKTHYGTGYLLSIDLMPSQNFDYAFDQNELLLSVIKKHIPETEKRSATAQQLTVVLPTESKKSFPNLFIDLEQNAEKYGISSFGLSLNTLEQVFLKVGELEDGNSTTTVEMEGMAEQLASILYNNSFVHTGLSLYLAQVRALIKKRFICYWKQWTRLIWQIFLPITVLLLVVFYMKNWSTRNERKILLNAGRISPCVVPLQLENPEVEFGFNILQIVKNIADYSYTLVPLSESIELNLAKWPKKPPPIGMAISYNTKNDYIVATAFFNIKARYGPVIAMTLINNARLGQFADSIKVSFLPYGNVSNVDPSITLNSQMFLIGPVLIIIFAFVSSGFVTYIVDDLYTNFLHQQLRTRLNTCIYWLSVIVSDLIIYTFICAVCVVILWDWLNNLKFHLVLLWLMYLWPTLPFVYCMAFLIKHPARAYIMLIIITLVVALCASITSYAVLAVKPELFSYFNTAFLFMLPTYSMAYSLMVILAAVSKKDTSILYSWEKLGRVYVVMTCSGLLFWIILVMINFKPLKLYVHDLLSVIRGTPRSLPLYENTLEDIDIKKERECMSKKRNTELSLAVRNLNKYYGNLHAVRDLTFGVVPGECFGLLGVNGAGKTSTFDMLTGASIPDSGEAFISGCSILKKQTIGFCPQFDALHPKLTARQTLQLFASLLGFSNPIKHVETVLEAVSLTAQADSRVEFLSGGQRRRLSLAVALISQTDLILLDEPTAGVDAKTRRQIWCLLNAVCERQRAVLLTSHSMNECEALCNRIGIMDKGSLIAIGSPQHIKTRFGEKYTLSITTGDQYKREHLISSIKKIFPGSVEKSAHSTRLLWDIAKKENDRWSEMYGRLCRLVERFPWIIDYSLTQTTLEEAFLRLSQREK